MNIQRCLLGSVLIVALCPALYAQRPPDSSTVTAPAEDQPGGAQRSFQQRLNTIVRKADGTPATPDSGEGYDPLAFYRKNPELMKRYFPHLFVGNNPSANVPTPAQGPGTIVDSIKFPGGTAQALIDTLKSEIHPAPNVMIAPKLRAMEVPEFELQNVTLADLFQALNNLSEDKSAQWILSGSTEPIWVLNPVNNPPSQGAPQPGYGSGMPGGFGMASIARDPLTGQLISSNARSCQILPVGKYLGKYKVEDITTAVKTAWGMMGDDAGAQMKYHKDTNLLITVGTAEQLSVLNQVLSSLESGLTESKRDLSDVPVPAKEKKF
jgi:hypothetical protein